jgi:hypothetical protein
MRYGAGFLAFPCILFSISRRRMALANNPGGQPCSPMAAADRYNSPCPALVVNKLECRQSCKVELSCEMPEQDRAGRRPPISQA